MSTGTGLPTPRNFSGVVTNGSDREVVITPVAGQRVTLYGFCYDDDTSTPTAAVVLLGTKIIFTKTAVAAGEFVSLGYPQAFALGQAVTVRVTGTTAGAIHVSAGLGS